MLVPPEALLGVLLRVMLRSLFPVATACLFFNHSFAAENQSPGGVRCKAAGTSREAKASARLGKAVQRISDLSQSQRASEKIDDNSKILGRLARILKQNPMLLPEFMDSDLITVLDSALRQRVKEGVDRDGKANFTLKRKLTFNLRSVGHFLRALLSYKDFAQTLEENSAVALKIIFLVADHKVANDHLELPELSLLLRTSMGALMASGASDLAPRDIFLLSNNLRHLKLNPTQQFQKSLYTRIDQLTPLLSMSTLLSITLNLSYAGFSTHETLFEVLFDKYQERFPEVPNSQSAKIKNRNKKLNFFDSVAGALFNLGSPAKPSLRFKELFESSGLDIFSNRIFKVQAFYLYDTHVLKNRSPIMDAVQRVQIRDLDRPRIFRPHRRASGLEILTGKALRQLFSRKQIAIEHPVHPWLPDVDFFLEDIKTIIEVQGPFHKRKVLKESEDGELVMILRRENSFDRGKYKIFEALGYRVIQLGIRDLQSSVDDVARLIDLRLKAGQKGD